jgi:hypothetical protein
MPDTPQPSSLDQTIRTAIAQKRLVRIRYDGRVRVAEPHDCGIRKGVERLLGYQLRETPREPG